MLSQRLFRFGKTTQNHCMRWLSTEVAKINTSQPLLTLYLPKLQESRNFVVTHKMGTVKDLESMIQEEDDSVQNVQAIHSTSGIAYASSTPITYLLAQGFQLELSDENLTKHSISLAPMPSLASDVMGIKEKIKTLAGTLDIVENKMNIEKDLYERLEELKAEIEPLEEKKKTLISRSQLRTNMVVWGGLLAMGTQFGFLARLVWWDYSWDIMEPVTYFVTYGTAIGVYAYFVCVKSDYNFESARDRYTLRFFHKAAKRQALDIKRYNELSTQMKDIESNLNSLNNVGALLAVKDKIKIPQD